MSIRTGARGAGLALLLSAALVTAAAAPGAEAATKAERRLFRMINAARADRGLSTLKLAPGITDSAHRHSKRMANKGRIFHHACLPCAFPQKTYRSLGENVGVGGGVKAVHRALMNSDGHRANILCTCFRKVGVGVVRRDGRSWVTEMFWG